jgi:hypothetical protein
VETKRPAESDGARRPAGRLSAPATRAKRHKQIEAATDALQANDATTPLEGLIKRRCQPRTELRSASEPSPV